MKFKSKLTHAVRLKNGFKVVIGRMDAVKSEKDLENGKFPFYYNIEQAPPIPSISVYGNKVTIASEGSDEIRYTTDGSDPMEGTAYSSPFLITKDTTVKALAVKDGAESKVATKECSYTSPPSPPTLSQQGNTITLSSSGTDSVYYTLDGTEPDSTKTKYTAPFDISASCTLKAVGYKNGVKGTVLSQSLTYTEQSEEVIG